MSCRKVAELSTSFLLGATTLLISGIAIDAATSQPVREQAVAAFRRFEAEVTQFYAQLRAVVDRGAPELSSQLIRVPPSPVIDGYALLPTLTPAAPPAAAAERAMATSYSWPRTERLLAQEAARLTALAQRLAQAAGTTSVEGTALRGLVADYRQLDDNRRLIDAQIRHNQLWQDDVPKRRAMYDANTSLFDVALERNVVRDARLRATGDLAMALAATDAALSARLEAGLPRTTSPDYLRVERTAARHWVVHVPVVTDIEDAPFVAACRRAIEETWRVESAEGEFEVRVAIRVVTPTALYRSSSPPPRAGSIDVPAHVARFPADAAAITTGGRSTHVWGRAIVLGPQPISTTVLAHEFGHLLGLPDAYLRGYRDLGADGFEILEAVLDPTDLMSAPDTGRVSPRHFERLISPE